MPNVIYILADDMGYGDISYLNDSSGIQTPNIDQIGKQGMFFTDAHSPSAVCTPTRYGILTGEYAFKSRLKSGVLVGYSPSLIDSSQLTVAELLAAKGYTSGAVGKWHLGLDWKRKDASLPLFEGSEWDTKNTDNVDYLAEVRGGPTDHGFDYSFVNPASLDIAPYVYISNKKVTSPIAEHIEGSNSERGVFWRHGDRAEDFELEGTLDTFGEKATDFIKSRAKSNSPFFLYLPLTAPHTPWLPGEQYDGKSAAGKYGDFVMHVDAIVGQILKTLEQNEISDNTMVIFTSDNGSHWTEEDKQKYPHRANYVFRGMKSDAWEGGHRVPFLVRWPDVVAPGSATDETICLTDLLATMAEITNQPIEFGQAEDSYSILPVLEQVKRVNPIRPYTIHHSISGQFAIRKGKWKLIDHPGSGGWSYPGGDEDPARQLYNMSVDFTESTNLINEYPEVEKELLELLDKVRGKQVIDAQN